ncbi:hypothetical protein TraAM80_01692 [Trypanosoma rangeli]|uniref:Uncharacterized protein n=1 Tax=Trypanosoma rangeli TaxID=5698 RepID=A0A422NXS0_TRYRA|nr:uncharacterized protein TraAM80_01692 [Trypanosoma rangeli]RNF10332.1 hypothetical protein TraAM80_01692 [Trypanosoma rangeli]|eukprot:RNF10332.1 hypothetical protein TraAM80_01692 [Trypanosoma rangeli]
MIQDAEFWMEARRKHNGGDAIFTAMFPLLHARQVALDSGAEVDEDEICRDISIASPFAHKPTRNASFEEDEGVHPGYSNGRGKTVSTSVIRVMQQILMFAVPLYSLRYNIPAMSMSLRTSCVVDRASKNIKTFGTGEGVKVPKHLKCRGCVATDDFFAILTDEDEVWVSGGMNVLVVDNGKCKSGTLGKKDCMFKVVESALMVAGHGSRLACLTRAFIVRPLSILSSNVKSVIPSRPVRFLDLGYVDDYYMVGTDSVLYKTLASKRVVGTPRRVMTLVRTPVSRVACGNGFCLVIDQNGHLYTLGRNKKGQLGNGQQYNSRRKPYLHRNFFHHFFVMVAAGDAHSLALTSSGVVYAAGNNESGQLGLGETITEMLRFTPVQLPSKCVGIAAGPAGSMFACEDGHVYASGLNVHRQLGVDSSLHIVYTPTSIPEISSGVEAYTMDFGPAYVPSVITRLARESPGMQNNSEATSDAKELILPEHPSLLRAAVMTDLPRLEAVGRGEVPKKRKKKASCMKCCVTV